MEIKNVCDICGKRTNGAEYVLPTLDEVSLKKGTSDKILLTMSIKTIPRKYKLCPICGEILACSFYEAINTAIRRKLDEPVNENAGLRKR